MATFNAEISLPIRGSSLLSFNLSKCTGSGTGCTPLTDFQNVVWYRFPIIVPNLEYGVITYIQLIVNTTNGKCPTGVTINLPINNIPTPTPTITPTLTITPTFTPTLTPTITPTQTPIDVTPTLTPTITPTQTPADVTPTLTPDCLFDVDIDVVTPTPTPTPTTPLNRFYVASPVADIDETYCVTPGYVLTGALWSYATTISGLMNQQVYLDQNGNDVFIGVEGYKYAVSLTSGINTFTNGSSYYELIQIYENGTVWNVLSPNCGSSGGGGDVPQ